MAMLRRLLPFLILASCQFLPIVETQIPDLPNVFGVPESPGSDQVGKMLPPITTPDNILSIVESALNYDSINKALKPMYTPMTFFLDDVLQQKTIKDLNASLPVGVVNLVNNLNSEILLENWKVIVIHYLGYVICLGLCILLSVFFPIFAVCFCCCRCYCNTCGAAKPKASRGGSYCCCIILFFAVSVIAAVGVITTVAVAFQMRNLLPGGQLTQRLNDTIQHGEDFTQSILSSALAGIFTPIVHSKKNALDIIDNIPDKAFDDLDNATGIESSLTFGSDYFENISVALNDVNTSLMILQMSLQDLDATMTPIAANVNISGCGRNPECTHAINTLQLNATYRTLAPTTRQLQAADFAYNSFLGGQQAYIDMKQNFNDQIEEQVNTTRGNIDSSVEEIVKAMDEIEHQVNSLDFEPVRSQIFDIQDKYLSIYGEYLFYGFIALACIIVPAVLLLGVGFAKGVCGSKDRASCLMMTGVYIFMILATFIQLTCGLLLLTGGLVHTELCRYLSNPDVPAYNQSFQLAFDLLPLDGAPVDIQGTLRGCRHDQAIYTAVDGEKLFDISQYTDLDALGVIDHANQLKETDISLEKITIIDTATRLAFAALGQSLSLIDFDSFEEEMAKSFLGGGEDLARVVTYLESHKHPDTEVVRNISDHILPRLHKESALLSEALGKVKSLVQARTLDEVQSRLESTEQNVNMHSDPILRKALNHTVDHLVSQLQHGVETITYNIYNEIGRCRPAYDVIMSLTSTVCVTFLYPFNAYWFYLGWAFAFNFVAMFMAIKLSSQFRADSGSGVKL